MIEQLRPYIELGQQRWQQLAPREKLIVGVGSVLVVVWLIWQLVFVSLDVRLNAATTKLVSAEKQLSTLTQQASEIRRLRAMGVTSKQGSNAPMDQLVHPLARQYQLEIQKLDSSNDQLEVKLANCSFTKLMQFLAILEQRFGIVVSGMQLRSTSVVGVVEVDSLQLSRS